MKITVSCCLAVFVVCEKERFESSSLFLFLTIDIRALLKVSRCGRSDFCSEDDLAYNFYDSLSIDVNKTQPTKWCARATASSTRHHHFISVRIWAFECSSTMEMASFNRTSLSARENANHHMKMYEFGMYTIVRIAHCAIFFDVVQLDRHAVCREFSFWDWLHAAPKQSCSKWNVLINKMLSPFLCISRLIRPTLASANDSIQMTQFARN